MFIYDVLYRSDCVGLSTECLPISIHMSYVSYVYLTCSTDLFFSSMYVSYCNMAIFLPSYVTASPSTSFFIYLYLNLCLLDLEKLPMVRHHHGILHLTSSYESHQIVTGTGWAGIRFHTSPLIWHQSNQSLFFHGIPYHFWGKKTGIKRLSIFNSGDFTTLIPRVKNYHSITEPPESCKIPLHPFPPTKIKLLISTQGTCHAC